MLLFEVTSLTQAQLTYQIPTGFGWRLGLPFDLLEAEAVQSDLGISADKAYKLVLWRASVNEAAKASLATLKNEGDRRVIRQKVQIDFQSELDSILTQEQQDRLHEIDLQMEGSDALSDPSVAMALQLTIAQQDSIRSIHKRMAREEIDSLKKPNAKYLTFEDRDKLLLEVLTPTQQDQFKDLKGPPFNRHGFLPTLRLRDRELEAWNVKYSPDGKRLATSRQNNIYIWDAESGRSISCMRGHGANITSICFGPDGKWIVSASTDRTVKTWDVESGQNFLTHNEKHTEFNGWSFRGYSHFGSRWSSFRSMALSPDGGDLTHAIGASVSTWVRINPLVPPLFRGHEAHFADLDRQPVWSAAYSPDGKRIAYGRIDGVVNIYGVGKKTKFKAATDAVLCLAYSPDGEYLAIASLDGSVRVWGLNDGKELLIAAANPHAARYVAFSPDGKLLASASEDGDIKLWRVSDSVAPIRVMHHLDQATSVAFSPDSMRLASAGSDNVVRIWDTITGEEVLSLSP